MRRRIVIGIAAGLLAIGGGSALAYPGSGNSPGNNPDHPAWFGLCKAYERNAQQAKDNAPVFAELNEMGEDELAEFCGSRTPGGGAPGRP
jgi:hypothetical protein